MSDVSDSGFYLHIGRLFEIHTLEVHVATFGGGQVLSRLVRQDLDRDSMSSPGFTYTIDEPFHRWRLAYAEMGRPGAFLSAGVPELPFGFDISLHGFLPPVDMAAPFESLGFGGMSGQHYEQGFSWEGTITVGTEIFSGAGLGVRDHSWGSRHMTEHNTTWWTPAAFDDGDLFYAGLDMRRGPHRATFALRSDEDGNELFDSLTVDILEGDQVTYRRAQINYGPHATFTATTVARVPVPWLIGHGLPRLSDDAFCRLQGPTGDSGFCLLEMNRALTAAEQVGFGPTIDRTWQ